MSAAVAAVLLLSSCAAASAQSVSTTCLRSTGVVLCRTAWAPARDPHVVAIPADPEAVAREAKWSAYCEPRLGAPDVNGVRRYTYARPGCESGRSEE